MQVFRWCEVPSRSSLWRALGSWGLVETQCCPSKPHAGGLPSRRMHGIWKRIPRDDSSLCRGLESTEECLLGIHCHGRSCEECKLPHLNGVGGMSSLLPVESRSSSFIGFIGLIPQLNVLKSSWVVSLAEILFFFPPFWLYVKSI